MEVALGEDAGKVSPVIHTEVCLSGESSTWQDKVVVVTALVE